MTGALEYRFVIDAYSPETLPMSRLAEYMADLARLLGKAERVHFVRLEPGSTVLVQNVEPEAVPEVRKRIQAIVRHDAPADVAAAFKALNRHLANDNAIGSLQEGDGPVVRFPGRERPQPLSFGAFNEPGVLDGVLIRVGGRDDTVPVHLRDGDSIHVCNATREMAKRLAVYYEGSTLRVHGEGRWERDAVGNWVMKRFNIAGFEELDDAPLSEVVGQLRDVEGSGWNDVENPPAELQRLRGLVGDS